MTANSIAIFELILIGVVDHLKLSFLHLSKDKSAQLLIIAYGTFRLDLNFGTHFSRPF
jgi:hypothetical protein